MGLLPVPQFGEFPDCGFGAGRMAVWESLGLPFESLRKSVFGQGNREP